MYLVLISISSYATAGVAIAFHLLRKRKTSETDKIIQFKNVFLKRIENDMKIRDIKILRDGFIKNPYLIIDNELSDKIIRPYFKKEFSQDELEISIENLRKMIIGSKGLHFGSS